MGKDKLPWEMIYEDFKQRHPNLRKKVVKWHPHDYMMIMLYLDDGMKVTYDYSIHQAAILSTSWKDDEIKFK